MNTVTLTSSGGLIADGMAVDRPLMCLSAQVGLADDCTLRSFFRMITAYPLLSELSPFFEALLEQYRRNPPGGCTEASVSRLLLTKTVEMIGFPGKPRVEIYHCLYGVQGEERLEVREFPLETILDAPLKLGRLKHIVFGDKVDVFEFDTVFTLFEIIDAIVWELSFHGTLMACEIRR
jgi:hypothetical protein